MVSFNPSETASSAPTPSRSRRRGSVSNRATRSSIATLTSATSESSRPVRVTVSAVGLMVNSNAASGAPTRPSVRVERASITVVAMPATAATKRTQKALVPSTASTGPTR